MSKSLDTTATTMLTTEIAELTGKRHDNVMRDCENMFEELEIGVLKFEELYSSSNNQQHKCYRLDKRLATTLVSGYNTKMRAAIVDRWIELEDGEPEPKPIDNATTPESLKKASDAIVSSFSGLECMGFTGDQLKIVADNAGIEASGVSLLRASGVRDEIEASVEDAKKQPVAEVPYALKSRVTPVDQTNHFSISPILKLINSRMEPGEANFHLISAGILFVDDKKVKRLTKEGRRYGFMDKSTAHYYFELFEDYVYQIILHEKSKEYQQKT